MKQERVDQLTGEITTFVEKKRFDSRRLNELGQELVSPVPVAPPIGWKKTPSLTEQIRAMVRSEALRMAAEASGAETFEEADDFDVEDDPSPVSPYEEWEPVFDPAPSTAEPAPAAAPAAAEPAAAATTTAANSEVKPPSST